MEFVRMSEQLPEENSWIILFSANTNIVWFALYSNGDSILRVPYVFGSQSITTKEEAKLDKNIWWIAPPDKNEAILPELKKSDIERA